MADQTVPSRRKGPCARCHERLSQRGGPYCRRCARELGDTTTSFERDAAQVARLHARFNAATIRPEDLLPRPDIIRFIDGAWWVIVWDGT